MLQFMKKGDEWGEVRQARRIQGLRIEQFGSGRFIRKGKPGATDIRLAGRGMKRAREAVFGGRYDLVILDEINVAVDFGLVKMRDVLDLMRRKPPAVELVLTGRGARALVVRKADTVSEVREVKHHFRKGIPARAGVEF
jgi:cob(I)alamin adenosyltransferase